MNRPLSAAILVLSGGIARSTIIRCGASDGSQRQNTRGKQTQTRLFSRADRGIAQLG